MRIILSYIELSSVVPPDVIAAAFAFLTAVIGWLFGKRSGLSGK